MRLIASDIREYRFAEEDGPISPNHWSEGIESLSTDEGIAFTIELPAILTLRCGAILVEDLPHLVETVQPWLSDREVYACVPGMVPPTSAEWVTQFAQHGERVSWHIYADGPKPTSEVPFSEYRGWYLQDPSALDSQCQGIFFFASETTKDGLSVQVANAGASSHLWRAAQVILGEFSGVEVHWGNCVLSGPECLMELEKVSSVL